MRDSSGSLASFESLTGARIWISGSRPEADAATDAQRTSISTFARDLAKRVFGAGGHVIHGTHPSLTPILLEEASAHAALGGRKDRLILAISRLWSKDRARELDEWRKVALVYETPEATGTDAKHRSLQILRQWMATRSDAVVAVGGKWRNSLTEGAGVPIELELALEQGLPCFVLGGFGGSSAEFVTRYPEILGRLKNGLDPSTNAAIATSDDVSGLAELVCANLGRLPLVRGKGSDGVSFRILALDGGGLKGAFTAAALAAWEAQTKLRVVDHFDLIAGTSTGGLLAIGLGLGLSAAEMLQFYKTRGPVIFPMMRLRGRLYRTARHIFRPKFAQEVLLRELESAYYAKNNGNPIVLRDSRCRLVIPAYHAVGGLSHQFRTPHHPNLTVDAGTQAAHAALATAAAPTFFSAARIAGMVAEAAYFDGGVWANSPALAAAIEATCFLAIPPERIDVLSVGTTDEPFTTRWQTRSGIVGWLWRRRILNLFMNAQQESSLRLASNYVGEPKFLRVNKTTPPGSYALDSPSEIDELADLGQSEASRPDVLNQVRSRFLNGVTVAPWERFG